MKLYGYERDRRVNSRRLVAEGNSSPQWTSAGGDVLSEAEARADLDRERSCEVDPQGGSSLLGSRIPFGGLAPPPLLLRDSLVGSIFLGSSLFSGRPLDSSLRGGSFLGSSPDGESLHDRAVPQVRHLSAGCETTCEPIIAESVLQIKVWLVRNTDLTSQCWT